jgi:hypothetical protein
VVDGTQNVGSSVPVETGLQAFLFNDLELPATELSAFSEIPQFTKASLLESNKTRIKILKKY